MNIIINENTKNIYFNGHYHKEAYQGNILRWRKTSNLLDQFWISDEQLSLNGLEIKTFENGVASFEGTYISQNNCNICFAPVFMTNAARPDSWITSTILPKGKKYRLEIKVLSGTISLTNGSTNTNSFNVALGLKATGNPAAIQCNLLEDIFLAENIAEEDISTARLFIASGVYIKAENYKIQYLVTEV